MSPGATLLLLLSPEGATPTLAPAPTGTQFVGPFGWSFLFPGDATSVTPATPAIKPCDRAAFDAILAILHALDAFDEVRIDRTFQIAPKPADSGTTALIQPGDPTVVPDGSPEREFRTVPYTLTLATNFEESPDEAYRRLDRLEDRVRNVLLAPSAKAYGGFCLSRYSALRAGSINVGNLPLATNRITGQFAYSVALSADDGFGYSEDV